MMNNELRPYEAYKPTNLPWLDEIPAHWSLSRNKNVMLQNKALVGLNHAQYKLLSLTLNGVIARDMVNPKGKFPKEFDTYQVVSEKNLVFCLFDIDETPRTVGISPMGGMITGAYTVFKVANANERFLYYYYLSIDNNKMLKPLYTGLRKVISADTFLRTKLPIPPRPEQDQIVKYLDHQLFKINKFIKAKKKLITVLKEQKQAIINELVTKGLDSGVKLKPSGVEWLGDVPEHWEVVRIKNIKDRKKNAFVDGPFGSNLKSEHFIRNGYAYVIESNFATRGKLDLQGLKTISRDHFYTINRSEVRTGDIVIAKIGAYFGYSNILPFIDKPAVVSGNSLKLSIDQLKCDVRFVNYQLKAIKNMGILDLEVKSTAQPALSLSYLNTVTMVLPPKKEQENIAEQINKRNEMIDSSIVAIENEITLIAEYKNSLTTDVVTGKLDVRHVLIDETEEMGQDDFELDEDSIDKEEIIEDEEGDE